jgi:hypothetical protein
VSRGSTPTAVRPAVPSGTGLSASAVPACAAAGSRGPAAKLNVVARVMAVVRTNDAAPPAAEIVSNSGLTLSLRGAVSTNIRQASAVPTPQVHSC